MVRRLLNEGVDVVSVDSLISSGGGHRPTVGTQSKLGGASFTFHEEDCRSYFARTSEKFDYIFHLAAVVGGRSMIENNPIAVAEDLSIDAAMWNWSVINRPGRVVFFSSSAAYPIGHQKRGAEKLLSEDMISFDDGLGMPDLSYGWSKLTGEYLMQLYNEQHGGTAVAYRPFSGYGEEQDSAYPFPAICQRMMAEKGAETVSVWGTGEQVRDFIHIDDCIDFIWRSFDSLDSGDCLNLSTAIPTTFLSLASEICRQIGWEPTVIGTPNTPEGVFYRCGDDTRQKALGLIPQIPLNEGIARMLDLIKTQDRVA